MVSISSNSPKIIRVGHSPDPDDAFMFYALAHGKVRMPGFTIEHVVEDIESLNQRALCGELEVTAVSCHAYAYLTDRYALLRSGASVGDGYGPILVARKGNFVSRTGAVQGKKIAIPGKLTTAFLALQIYENDFLPVIVPFDQIFKVLETGGADLGLIIHEGQMTYAEHGCEKILDLGTWWHDQTGLPLPLGLDVIRRDLGKQTIESFAAAFRTSIEFGLLHRQEALSYAMQFGRGISDKLADHFVGMYVNDYTVDLGERALDGLKCLFREAYQKALIPSAPEIQLV